VTGWGPPEMMAVALARLVGDGETVFVGVNSPLPLVAATLARRLHAPDATLITIAGGVNATPARLSATTTAAGLAEGSASIFDNADFYDFVARGGIDLAFLGAAQVDAAGHLNTSVIGPHERPTVRFPGGGGAAFILPLAGRTVVWRASHSRRVFVERVDFVTASGRLDRVVTPLCVFRMDGGRLEVESVHPSSTAGEVARETGFPVHTSGVPSTAPPSEAELTALREVDPDGVRAAEFSGQRPASR